MLANLLSFAYLVSIGWYPLNVTMLYNPDSMECHKSVKDGVLLTKEEAIILFNRIKVSEQETVKTMDLIKELEKFVRS